jgi:hypothetical protein
MSDGANVTNPKESLANALGIAGQQIQHFIADLEARLRRSMQEDRQHIAELEKTVDQITNHPRTGDEPGATQLEALLGKLLQGYQDHEERLANLSQQRTAERVTGGTYVVHQEIAQRYRNLVSQDLLDIAASLGNRGPLFEAETRSALAYALFHPELVRQEREQVYAWLWHNWKLKIRHDRFCTLWDMAANIRAEADKSGHSHAWDFDFAQNSAVDSSRQDIYEGCRPGDPVIFLVAPAYIVEGNKVYVKQLVFTGAGQAEDESSAGSQAEGSTAQSGTPEATETAAEIQQAIDLTSDPHRSSAGQDSPHQGSHDPAHDPRNPYGG